ncbi:hypothetical protein ACUXJ9_002598 [Staphylococcus caledonicus]
MPRTSKRQLKKNKSIQRKQLSKIEKDKQNHKNNPTLLKQTEEKYQAIINKPIAQAKAIGLKADEIIDKTNKLINDIDNKGFSVFTYNSIIRNIQEKVNQLKPKQLYNKLEEVKINIPEELLDNKQFEIIEKTIKPEYIYNKWLDDHVTHVRETEHWCYMELNMLDMMLVDHKEYLGLLINSQFAQNFEKASKLAGDDLVALDELNKIINEEVLVDDNNAHHTYQRIVDRFNELKDEVFYESEQVREELVKNADNRIKTARNMSKAEKDKIFGRN